MSQTSRDERHEAYRKVMSQLGGIARDEVASNGSSAQFPWLEADALCVELFEYGEIWARPGLDLRTRTLITIAVVSILNHPEELETQMHHALNLGVDPAEISEAVLHASVYGGIPSYRQSIQVARRVFQARGVGSDGDLPTPQTPMTPTERRLAMQPVLGAVKLRRIAPRDDAERIVPLASGHLSVLAEAPLPAEQELYRIHLEQGYGAIWGRDVLDLRTRSFLTVTLLQVLHEDDQLFIHVNNALNLGIEADELEEALAHAGLYGGTSSWHNATHVARDVFIKRGLQRAVESDRPV